MKIQILAFLAAIFFVLALSACATGGASRQEESASTNEEDLEEQQAIPPGIYQSADADGLYAGMDGAVEDISLSLFSALPQGAGVLVASFVNAEDMNDTTTLGRLLGARFATGLTEAGYHVKESRLRANLALKPGQGEFVLSRRAADLARQTFEVSAVLYGFYMVDQDAVYVSARVALTGDGSIVGAKDFALLNRRAVTRMLGENHASVFERYVRTPVPIGGAEEADTNVQERDLTEGPAENTEPAFRIFPPERLNP